jgi:hypothetical protein
MNKNVKSVKNSLKFKARQKSGAITVRIGVKKYTVPVDARLLSSDGYLFLSLPAVSELYRIENKQLKAMDPSEDAAEAYEALNPGRRQGRRRRGQLELPSELEQALKKLPPGTKLGYDAEGNPRLVRKRNRGGGASS